MVFLHLFMIFLHLFPACSLISTWADVNITNFHSVTIISNAHRKPCSGHFESLSHFLSHKAGTPYQDLIRANREFPGVQAISLHTQKTPIH